MSAVLNPSSLDIGVWLYEFRRRWNGSISASHVFSGPLELDIGHDVRSMLRSMVPGSHE